MTPPTICFPETRIPAEREDSPATYRFYEPTQEEVVWDADRCYQQRLADPESVPLEIRGITSQKPAAPHSAIPLARQTELWKSQTIHKYAVAAKLREAGLLLEAATLENCHTYYTIALCNDCGKVSRFPNRCDIFYCPQCLHHLQHERIQQVGWWAQLVPQPKHLILTIRNITDLTGGHVDEFRRYFTKLRRTKFAKNWVGGFYRLEVTNDGNGWHLHLHALINAKWIDQDELKQRWNRITNGLGYIVKVRDCRESDYLREVTKYVVKGSMLAAWSPDQIATFVRALTGKRTFGVFGDLYGARTEFAEYIATLKTARPKCSCGSCSVRYYTEAEFLLRDLQPDPPHRAQPPPATPDFSRELAGQPAWPD